MYECMYVCIYVRIYLPLRVVDLIASSLVAHLFVQLVACVTADAHRLSSASTALMHAYTTIDDVTSSSIIIRDFIIIIIWVRSHMSSITITITITITIAINSSSSISVINIASDCHASCLNFHSGAGAVVSAQRVSEAKTYECMYI